MDQDTFFAGIRKALVSSGCDLDRVGFSMAVERGRWRVTRPRSIYDNDAITLSGTTMNAGCAASAVDSLRRWWGAERNRQTLIAAHDWLYGARDGVQRAYAIDKLILRHFELAGIDREELADLLRRQIGPRPGVDQILQRVDKTYSSFHNHAAPTDFEYRWRSGLTTLIRGFAPVGPIQMRLSGNAGRGMWCYFNIAPGAFYCGGASPAIWLSDKGVRDLPDTLLLAYRGQPASKLIGHPALDIADLRISSVRAERTDRGRSGRLTVGLKPCREELSAPPRLARAA